MELVDILEHEKRTIGDKQVDVLSLKRADRGRSSGAE